MTGKTTINYRHMFTSLLEAVPLAAFVLDRDLKVVQVNAAALKLCGKERLARHETISRLLNNEAIARLARKCVQSGTTQKASIERTRSNVTWHVTVAPLEHQSKARAKYEPGSEALQEEHVAHARAEEPESLYFLLSIEDMAEMQRLESIQREFLANISHELRTPLTSALLLTETLEDVIETDPQRSLQFLNKIETELQYLSSMVAELLELSRLEAGQVPMNFEFVEAEQLVREVMARMLPLAQRHRVSLLTDIEQGTTRVHVDSKLITRVLFNLVHNAIKFTPSGGKITVGTTRVKGEQARQSFFVRDTGVGMREEDLARVFERFYKVDRARAKANFIGPGGGGGAGLGLAIARQVVEAHGGNIKAESTVEKGSIFSFTLPIIPG